MSGWHSFCYENILSHKNTGLLKYCATDHADEERLEVNPVGQKADNGDAPNSLAFLEALLQSLHFGVDVKVWSAQETK